MKQQRSPPGSLIGHLPKNARLNNTSNASQLKKGVLSMHSLRSSKRLVDKSKSINELCQPYLRKKHDALKSSTLKHSAGQQASEHELTIQSKGGPTMSHFASITRPKDSPYQQEQAEKPDGQGARKGFDFNQEKQATRPLLQGAQGPIHSPLTPLAIGETDPHYASSSVQKMPLPSPMIEHSSLTGQPDSTRGGTFRDNPVGHFITKEPVGPPRLGEVTPKATEYAVYAQNDQSEPAAVSRTQLRKEQNLSRQVQHRGTHSGISLLHTVPTSRIADSDFSKTTEFRNTANFSGLTPGLTKKQFSASQFNQFPAEFDQADSRTSAVLRPSGGTTGMPEPICLDSKSIYGNTTTKKAIYNNTYGMFGVNLGALDRPTSTASLERSKLSQMKAPQADVSAADGYKFTSPRHGFEQQHSKDRILNTTFQQKKFQDFERRAKQQERLNYHIIEQNRGATTMKKTGGRPNRNEESTPDILRNKMKSTAFFQGQTANEEPIRIPAKKAVLVQQKVIGKVEGDRPVDPDAMSNASHNSQFHSELKPISALWSCKQLKPIKPSMMTAVSGLFEQGMGIEAPASMRCSVSMPRLNIKAQQRLFNRQRDCSYHAGSMRSIMNYEDAPGQQPEFLTERVGLKMVNMEMFPNHRLNSSQKEHLTSTFGPLFQSKIRHGDIVTPTQVDEVVFQQDRRSLTPNTPQVQGVKTFVKKDRMNDFMRQSDVCLRNMVEQYKNEVNRRASQLPDRRQRSETVSELLSMGKQESGPFGPKVAHNAPKMVGNPNTHKNAKNRRNASTIFSEAVAVAQAQEDDVKKTHKILQMYKKMKSNQPNGKEYRVKHKNQESTEVPKLRLKQLSQPGNIQTRSSNEFHLAIFPGSYVDPETTGSQTQRYDHRMQQVDGGRRFGVASSSRAQSQNRNEFTAHLNSARGQGACRESSNAFRSQIQLI